ncbi:MAG: hypothetical protein HZC29_02805 [Thaumarchaeota archaeon]|nr:hypothetical protein [Nitrososphaerota archaeon]
MLTSRILYPTYDEKCKRLTLEQEIRFAGVLDEYGRLVAGGFKEGLVPLERDKKRLHGFMKFVAEISLRRSLDHDLGPINYLAARRDKIVLISFPFPIAKMTLLISADKEINIEKFASHVIDVFSMEQARLTDR